MFNLSSELDVGVVGSSNSAWALSCYLSQSGFNVHILVRDYGRVKGLVKTAAICAEGKINGIFKVQNITSDEKAFLDSVQTVFIATTATAYREVMARLAPYLRSDHSIILFSSKLGGVLEAYTYLRDSGMKSVRIIETDALFACRITDDHTVWIRGFKGWNLFSSERKSSTIQNAHLIRRFFPNLEPAVNFIQRGLTDFGAMSHPLIMLINMNAVDRKEKFLFYREGFTENTVHLLESLEQERNTVADAYETPLISLAELLDRYYDCRRDTLHETLLNVPNYRHSMAPDTLQHRYIFEDVSCTLVPLYHLARKARVKTPLIDALINIASVILDRDFLRTGRSLRSFGLERKSRREIIRWMQS